MKKRLVLFLSLVTTCCSTVVAQIPGPPADLFTSHRSPMEHAIKISEGLFLPSQVFLRDSSWYSQWIQGTAWQLNQREFLTYNGSGSLVQDLYLILSQNQVWENYNRYLTVYGTSGTIVSSTGQTWNSGTGLWIDFMHSHYDIFVRLDTSWYKQFDHNTNSFVYGSRNLYAYNSSNQMTEILMQNLDVQSNTWVNNARISNTYNSSGFQTVQLTEVWDPGPGSWVNNQKYEYTYDPGNYLTGYLFSVWNTTSNQWIFNTEAVYTNSASGLPVLKLYRTWDPSASSWKNSEQITIQYNSAFQVTDELDQLWNTGTSQWIDNWKSQYAYYQNNFQKTKYQWHWNSAASIWTDTYYSLNDSLGSPLVFYSKSFDPVTFEYTFGDRYDYSYNTQHNCTDYVHSSLNLSTGNWVPAGRRLFTYDPNGNNTEQLDQLWDTIAGTYVNFYLIENFFSPVTGTTESLPPPVLCLFENPVRKGTPVYCRAIKGSESCTLDLYSLQGQPICSTVIRAGMPFIIPAYISSGTYILRLIQGIHPITSGKIVVTD
jgi:hypothetical protein